MQIKRGFIILMITSATVIGVLAVVFILFSRQDLSAVFPAVLPPVTWHIQGQVFDKSTNSLADVYIKISGTIRVTGANQIFGTDPLTFVIATNTDANGKFSFNCRAAFFQVFFSKDGYAESQTNFEWITEPGRDNTNQNLKIILTSE